MKCFVGVVLCVIIAGSHGIPQGRGSARFISTRQEVSDSAELRVIPLIPKSDIVNAPYPPSGWKPTGERLQLPARLPLPKIEYAKQSNGGYVYNPPTTEFEVTTAIEDDSTTTEQSTTAAEEMSTVTESVTSTEGPLTTPPTGSATEQSGTLSGRLRLPVKLSLPTIEYAKKSAMINNGYIYNPPRTETDEVTTVIEESAVTTTEESTTVIEEVTTVTESATETATGGPTTTPPSVDEFERPQAERLVGNPENAAIVEEDVPMTLQEPKDEFENVPVSLGQLNAQGAYYVLLPESNLQGIFYRLPAYPQRQMLSSRQQTINPHTFVAPLILYTQ